jgi:hypothetical protein
MLFPNANVPVPVVHDAPKVKLTSVQATQITDALRRLPSKKDKSEEGLLISRAVSEKMSIDSYGSAPIVSDGGENGQLSNLVQVYNGFVHLNDVIKGDLVTEKSLKELQAGSSCSFEASNIAYKAAMEGFRGLTSVEGHKECLEDIGTINGGPVLEIEYASHFLKGTIEKLSEQDVGIVRKASGIPGVGPIPEANKTAPVLNLSQQHSTNL